jgi:dipeptidyl aminopeptidase/acylaminoacyl peptidase
VALTGDRIRLRVDIDVGDGAIAGFEGRLVYDHARLRVTDATGLQCDAVIRCPGGVSMTPHPFGDPVVELADGEVRFTVAAEGAAGTGIAGLLELAFDVMAHGAAIGELVSAGYTATPGGELLPARRGALDPLEIEARLVGRIVAASQDMASLFLLEPATSPVVRRIIPTPLAFHAWPAWSPDGERITFAGHPEPMHAMPDIYVMNADGSGLVNLTDSPTFDAYPSWSPDGERIAFASNRDGATDIFVMGADGSDSVNLTRNDGGSDIEPAWSPDGARIAFTRNVSAENAHQDVWVMDADGANPVNLTGRYETDQRPAWSPDGSSIAYMSYRGGFEIWVMNADGTGQASVTGDFSTDAWPAWSPDGIYLAFTRGGILHVATADGGVPRPLTTGLFPAWTW